MYEYGVTAIGELLIDFTENGTSAQGNPILEANPGGAPCNVLSMLNRLGHKTAFLGKVGKDMFGDQLEAALKEVGIETKGLKRDDEVHTTLAFVHTLPDGDREFSFYRNPGADMMYSVEDIDEDLIKNCGIFHFGTLSMTHEGCREATRAAIALAEKEGKVLSFDPNLRENLWNSLDEAKEQIMWGLGHCNILKISDNEIQWLTGEEDYDKGVAWIRSRYDISLILVSLGKEGSLAYQGNKKVFVKAFQNPDTIETTGAGDTFCACVLSFVLEHDLREYTDEELAQMLTFANGAASIVTTKKGALRVMPNRGEVEEYLSER